MPVCPDTSTIAIHCHAADNHTPVKHPTKDQAGYAPRVGLSSYIITTLIRHRSLESTSCLTCLHLHPPHPRLSGLTHPKVHAPMPPHHPARPAAAAAAPVHAAHRLAPGL